MIVRPTQFTKEVKGSFFVLRYSSFVKTNETNNEIRITNNLTYG
jgi:hypothetical protein